MSAGSQHKIKPLTLRALLLCSPCVKKFVLLIILSCLFHNSYTQPDSTKFLNTFLTPAEEFNKTRFNLTLGTEVVLYGGFSYLLYNYWYKDYELVKFHLFNDMGEWNQMDKVGHMYAAFFETNMTTGLYNWTGVKDENTYWAGAVSGSLLQLMIETMDGFSEKWGFSIGDFAANSLGAGLSMGQNYAWDEQRIRIKFSSHLADHSNDGEDAVTRSEALFGTGAPERVLKDYNGQTYWLSINPSMFMPEETKFPKWLMISAGYGSEGLYGGFENCWCPDPEISPEFCSPEMLIDRSDIERYRQYYLSLDVDLTQIKTDSPFWQMLFEILSIVKIPAPAIEFNQGHGIKAYVLYF